MNLRDAVRGHDRVRRARDRQALRAEGQDRGADGPPARLAPAREARARRRQAGRPAALFDFGLFFFHNATRAPRAAAAGPYFYLPKLESHLEARLWNDVFVRAQERLGLPRGTIKATVLIETLPAAFEMDEILCELREHSAGLNCGRWDYIFSFIKKLRADPTHVLPDRAQVTMDKGVPARLRAAPHPDLPPPRRPRHGRHGGADPDQGRPGGERGGARQGARRQAPRGDGRPRRHLGRAPRARPDRQGDLRRST